MAKPTLNCHHPICMFAHDLVNNLSAIAGYCDLSQDPSKSEQQRAKYLERVREIAGSMAEKLKHHQCQPDPLAPSITSQDERVIS
jgi:hypothetical protein